MSAFRFRMERLRRVREIEEKLAREEWLVAQDAARAALAFAEAKREALEQAVTQLRKKQTEPAIAPAEILVEHAHIESLRRARSTAQLTARARAVDAERLFSVWKARDAAKLGLERLEERARATHNEIENHKEARAMDEVASMRAARVTRSLALAERMRAAGAREGGSRTGEHAPGARADGLSAREQATGAREQAAGARDDATRTREMHNHDWTARKRT